MGYSRQEIGEAAYGLASMVVRSRPRDMSLTAVSTLATLDRGGARRLGELAASEGVAQPSMTAVVAQLEQAGLVARRQDPNDGRVVLVAITRAGRARLRVRRRAAAAGFARLISELPDHEAAALEAAVPALRHLFDLAADSSLSALGVA
jgi:DNA-binding MarR family transcriptional regulator